MAFNCLSGCVVPYQKIGLRKPVDEAILMPWVEVWIENKLGNQVNKISVSNVSAKKNLASIKSFQFGMSNGTGVQIEIVDEEGGSFTNFFNKITTGNLDSSDKYKLKFQFGWASAGCDGSAITFRDPVCCPVVATGTSKSYRSCVHTMVIINVSVGVARGLFQFTIEGADMTSDMTNTRVFESRGSNTSPMPLTIAIKEMFKQWGIEVEFKKLVGACQTTEMTWNVNSNGKIDENGSASTLGPSDVWRALNRNPIQAARSWLSMFLTDRRRGIITFWNLSQNENKPKLIFMESTIPSCDGNDSSSMYHLGTYIVNGGACSPVISFNADIKYNMSQLNHGTIGTAGDSQMSNAFRSGPEACLRGTRSKFQGMSINSNGNDTAFQLFGNKGGSIVADARLEHTRVNLINNAITSELRIQGDPSFDTPILLNGHYVSLVYISPFRVVKNSDGCNFLSSGCQEQLSNTNWMITSVFHEIKEGSFNTVLKLMLATPGVQISRDAPLGNKPGAPTIP